MCISLRLVRLPRRDTVQQAAKAKIYTEQLQQQKLTLDGAGCMINHRGEGGTGLQKQEKRGRGRGGCANLGQGWDVERKKKAVSTTSLQLLVAMKSKSSVSYEGIS